MRRQSHHAHAHARTHTHTRASDIQFRDIESDVRNRSWNVTRRSPSPSTRGANGWDPCLALPLFKRMIVECKALLKWIFGHESRDRENAAKWKMIIPSQGIILLKIVRVPFRQKIVRDRRVPLVFFSIIQVAFYRFYNYVRLAYIYNIYICILLNHESFRWARGKSQVLQYAFATSGTIFPIFPRDDCAIKWQIIYSLFLCISRKNVMVMVQR